LRHRAATLGRQLLQRVEDHVFWISKRALGNSRRAVVSLTFDDAKATQRDAAALLAEHDLKATFYVPSGSVGGEGHLDWSELVSLQAAGHEIGGHTLEHVHLRRLDRDEARRQIIDDRDNLQAHGLEPRTFAYPFGEHDVCIQRLVADAGYLAARDVGGGFDSLPPRNLYALSAPPGARGRMRADALIDLARRAERSGRWLMLVFHHIRAGHPGDYSTDPEDLERLFDWLTTADVQVRPVVDVIIDVTD
jgi:peptidoglycan/xylan/chitin deacetylase (PgdA/CDA1 family)